MSRFAIACFWMALLASTALTAAQPTTQGADSPIDWDRARLLYQKNQRGAQLTTEEQQYLQRAMAQRQGARAGKVPPPRESTGLVPLTDMSPDQKYKDQSAGLYGDG